jgi:hypothetical protein
MIKGNVCHSSERGDTTPECDPPLESLEEDPVSAGHQSDSEVPQVTADTSTSGEMCIAELPRRTIIDRKEGTLGNHVRRHDRSNEVKEANVFVEKVDGIVEKMRIAFKPVDVTVEEFIPMEKPTVFEDPLEMLSYIEGYKQFDNFEKLVDDEQDAESMTKRCNKLQHRLRLLLTRCLGQSKLDLAKTPLFLYEEFPFEHLFAPHLKQLKENAEFYRIGAVRLNNWFRGLRQKQPLDHTIEVIAEVTSQIIDELETMAKRLTKLQHGFCNTRTQYNVMVIQNQDLHWRLDGALVSEEQARKRESDAADHVHQLQETIVEIGRAHV